jgi:uncharacterized membrane protein YkvA (DUF1232 family)
MGFIKPKTKWGQIFVVLTAFIGLFLAVSYVVMKIDIIPDSVPGIGWLDDTIVIFLFFALGWKMIDLITSRYKSIKASRTEIFSGKWLIDKIKTPNTWMVLLLMGFAVWYWFQAIDIFPDALTPIGHLDDILIALAALVAFMRWAFRKRS